MTMCIVTHIMEIFVQELLMASAPDPRRGLNPPGLHYPTFASRNSLYNKTIFNKCVGVMKGKVQHSGSALPCAIGAICDLLPSGT